MEGKLLSLWLLLGAFFLFILLRAVCVLFGSIAIWYSWVKFPGGFSAVLLQHNGYISSTCVLPFSMTKCIIHHSSYWKTYVCVAVLCALSFVTCGSSFLHCGFDLISSGFGCCLSLSFFHCVFDYCAAAWATVILFDSKHTVMPSFRIFSTKPTHPSDVALNE